MSNQSDQEHTTFYDQADEAFESSIHKRKDLSPNKKDDVKKADAEVDAEEQVRETEDASLQDDSYSFDEANTDNEEYHDASDADGYDIEREDDFLQ